jgi:hypothetical protein
MKGHACMPHRRPVRTITNDLGALTPENVTTTLSKAVERLLGSSIASRRHHCRERLLDLDKPWSCGRASTADRRCATKTHKRLLGLSRPENILQPLQGCVTAP